jgi:hypothetical protein
MSFESIDDDDGRALLAPESDNSGIDLRSHRRSTQTVAVTADAIMRP